MASPDDNGRNGWKVFTRRGRALAADADAFHAYVTAAEFPRGMLHPRLREDVWVDLARGQLAIAVFRSFREVEEAVRRAGGFRPEDIGVKLMRDAFHPDNGPLTRVPELTEKVDASLKAKSTKIFTLAALYDANSDLLKDQDEDAIEDNAKRLAEYWAAVAEHMADWNKVLTGHKLATELRSESISSHSTVLRALGGLGAELMNDPDWKGRLAGLAEIDWSKTNSEWQNVCIVANSVVSNRQARAATKAYIKGRLGMTLTEAEQRSFDKAAA